MRRSLTALLIYLLAAQVLAQSIELPTGVDVMQEVQRRHQLGASIYEELTLILTDRLGNRDTRNLRRYYRMDRDGNARFLVLFDTPEEVRGVALLVRRDAVGNTTQSIYLPAAGKATMQAIDAGPEGYIIGTDFSLEQMLGEPPAQYQYVLAGREKIGNINHFLIDVYSADANIASAQPLRRHYVREDTFFISRTDYLDPQGRVQKQKTLYDLRQIGPDSWRAGMVLMENSGEGHRTLLKVNRTVLADEFVPEEVFSESWLYANQPPFTPTETAALPDTVSAPVVEDPRQIIIGPEVH